MSSDRTSTAAVEEPKGENALTKTESLEEVGGKTRLTTRSAYQSAMDRDMVVQSGMESGASESMDRLAELLATA